MALLCRSCFAAGDDESAHDCDLRVFIRSGGHTGYALACRCPVCHPPKERQQTGEQQAEGANNEPAR